MNKEQFLRNLRWMLRKLPADELERILAYYREMIEDKVESGQSEEDAVRGLGDIRALAQKILAENPNRRPKDVGKIIAVSVLSLFGVVLVASIALACFSIRWDITKNGLQFVNGTSISNGNYDYKTYQVKPDGVTTVDLSADDKAIVIEPADSNQITVEYATNKNEKYDFSCEHGTLKIQNEERGVWNRWGWNDYNAPRITISLPRNYSGSIKADTTNSYIQVKELSSLKDLSCETTNSYIKVSALTAQSLNFKTENAAISLDTVNATSKLTAETQNATINLTDINSPDISLHTQNAIISGTIHGNEDDYSIDAETTNAISNLKNRSGGSKKLSVETTNAIISVKFRN